MKIRAGAAFIVLLFAFNTRASRCDTLVGPVELVLSRIFEDSETEAAQYPGYVVIYGDRGVSPLNDVAREIWIRSRKMTIVAFSEDAFSLGAEVFDWQKLRDHAGSASELARVIGEEYQRRSPPTSKPMGEVSVGARGPLKDQ